MRNEDASAVRCVGQDLPVIETFESQGGSKVHGWLSAYHAPDDILVEVGVSLKANLQDCFDVRRFRAAFSFS